MFISVTNPTSRSSCLNPFRSKRGKGFKKTFHKIAIVKRIQVFLATQLFTESFFINLNFKQYENVINFCWRRKLQY